MAIINVGGWSIEYYGVGPYIISNGAMRVEVNDLDSVFMHLFRSETDVYELVKLLLSDLVSLSGRVSDLERSHEAKE